MLKEAIDHFSFPHTKKQDLIALIAKPGQDSKLLDKLRHWWTLPFRLEPLSTRVNERVTFAK